MWRCCSQIASDYMKSYINPLRLVSAPPPPLPAPPPVSQASALIASLVNLTRGTQGCPKIISFDKSNWHPNFWRVSSTFFFSAALHPHIFATPFAKKLTPFFHHSLTRESFSRFPFRYNFSSFLNKCLLFTSKDFWNLPFNHVWRVPGFMKEGKADNEHSNPVLLPLPLSSQHLHFSFTVVHFQNFLLEVVAIGRKNAGWESDKYYVVPISYPLYSSAKMSTFH